VTVPAAEAGSGVIGSPVTTGVVEPGTAEAEAGAPEAPQVEHVPIKKRGSRKR
jgi:ribonuclease E